jgi:hypothetical protein
VIAPCDGCGMIFNKLLNIINAKEWRSNICNVPVVMSHQCNNADCKYSIEGECCVEFQFCDFCLKNNAVVTKVFTNYATKY